MDELSNAVDVSLSGEAAEAAVAAAVAQIRAWGLTMPAVEPLPFDFGLGRFREVGEVEFWIANEVDAGYCGKFLFVFDGQTCPLHHHGEKHETFYIVKGRVRMLWRDRELDLREGDVLPVAPGERHAFTGVGPALVLEVSKPCVIDDNYFADPCIPIGRNVRDPAETA